jgi:hypothetical protein
MSHDHRTTDLLRQALADNGERISLEQFLAPLGERSYGFLLLLLALPNFIPLPLGGVMGLLIALVGAQMLYGLQRPWLPRRARVHAFARSSVEHFLARMTPLFARVERLCKPRLQQFTRRPLERISGFLLIAIGALLSLPIPFTNYPFGLIVLLFAVALIERDGALLLGVWAICIAVIVASLALSDVAYEWLRHWF